MRSRRLPVAGHSPVTRCQADRCRYEAAASQLGKAYSTRLAITGTERTDGRRETGLRRGSVTPLVLLTASAGTGFVATNLARCIGLALQGGAAGSLKAHNGVRAGLLFDHLGVEEVPDCVLLDARHHLGEHVKRLPLVFGQRVA